MGRADPARTTVRPLAPYPPHLFPTIPFPPYYIIMPYDPKKHHRRSIRLKGYDYGSEGLYFVTICTHQRLPLFGQIEDGEMHLTDIGKRVTDFFNALPEKYPQIGLGEFVVMPNHFHCILEIKKSENNVTDGVNVGQADVGSANVGQANMGQADPAPTMTTMTLGRVIGYFKYMTTKDANLPHPLWQRNYYEHIIRNGNEWEKIVDYIRNNPRRWQSDRMYFTPDVPL